jgi:hypothetical protein
MPDLPITVTDDLNLWLDAEGGQILLPNLTPADDLNNFLDSILVIPYQGHIVAPGGTRAGRDTKLAEVYSSARVITPSNSLDLSPVPHAFYIGGAGNLAIYPAGDYNDDSSAPSSSIVIKGLTKGTIVRVAARRVLSTGTTVTSIIGLI